MTEFQKHYWDYANALCANLLAFQKANQLTNAQIIELIVDIADNNIELHPEQDAG